MSLRIAKVKDIPIKLHFTLIIVFFLITWTVSSSFMPLYFPGLPSFQYWIMGIASAIILFVSVLLHELAHSILSLKYGLKVRQIILFLFGGVSDIKEETKDYDKEFKIAIAGPLTSFALAGLFLLSWSVLLQTAGPGAYPALPTFQGSDVENESASSNAEEEIIQNTSNNIETGMVAADNNIPFIRTISGILIYATVVNFLLGLFNLLPAFPLDGGRILRAALIRQNKSFDKSTRIAVRIGIAISYGIMAFGFITIFTGSFVGGIWLLIIGWFLQTGAQAYLQNHELSSTLSHVRLKSIMNSQFVSVNMNQTALDALINTFNKYRKSEFPVVDDKGSLVGSISAKQIMKVSEDSLEKVKISQIMTPIEELIVMSPESRADEALKNLLGKNKSRIFVCSNGGRSRSNINNIKKHESQKENLRQYINKPDSTKGNKEFLLGIISKSDLLNVAAEREEYENSVRDSNIKP